MTDKIILTPESVRDMLAARYPDRSINVKIDHWKMRERDPETLFSISVLPGFDGETCQSFGGNINDRKTFAELVELINEAAALEPQAVS